MPSNNELSSFPVLYMFPVLYIECSAEHIPGLKNEIADALSRLELSKFLLLVPHANIRPTLPSTIYYLCSFSYFLAIVF